MTSVGCEPADSVSERQERTHIYIHDSMVTHIIARVSVQRKIFSSFYQLQFGAPVFLMIDPLLLPLWDKNCLVTPLFRRCNLFCCVQFASNFHIRSFLCVCVCVRARARVCACVRARSRRADIPDDVGGIIILEIIFLLNSKFFYHPVVFPKCRRSRRTKQKILWGSSVSYVMVKFLLCATWRHTGGMEIWVH